MLYLHLILWSLVSFSSATCTDGRVFSLPVTDVTLSNRQLMRGVPVSLGTPAQNLSMMPQPYLNNTWIYNSTTYFCNSSWNTPTGCLTVRGGLYDLDDSTTAHNATDVYAAGGDASDTKRALDLHIWESEWINDKFTLGNHTLENFALGMPGFPIFDTYDTQSQFGLGLNSTLLHSLKSVNAIASRAYSWWWGMQGATSKTDGQFVLGGYDAAKVQGGNYTKALSTPSYPTCNSGMLVTITDLILTFPNSTTASILSPNQLLACILPDYPHILTMPWDTTYARFESATQTQSFGRVGGNGIAFGGVGYWPEEVYQGSLTVKIDNVIEFVFPNELLVVPPTDVSANGAIKTNDSVREVLLNPTTGNIGNNPPILGRHFLQMAYLMVDYETETFALWNANTTSTETELIALDDCTSPTNLLAGGDSTRTASSTDTGSTSGSTPSTSSGKKSEGTKVSTGAIAGIAVGGTCAIIATVSALALLRLRRRSKRMTSNPNQSSTISLAPCKPHQPGCYSGIPMMHEAMSAPVNELYGYRDPTELDADFKSHDSFYQKHWKRERSSVHHSPAELGSP